MGDSDTKHSLVVCNAVVRKGDTILLTKTPEGQWGYSGGKVEAGETMFNAACNEVQEETGLIVRPTGIWGIFQSKPLPDVWITNFSFNADVIGGTPRPNGRECTEVNYLNPCRLRPEEIRTPDVLPIYGVTGKNPLPLSFIKCIPTMHDRKFRGEKWIIERSKTICSVVVQNQERFVLVRETKTPYNGVWSFSGGYVEFEGFSHETIKRKTKQETGLDIELLNVIGCYQHRTASGEWVTNICYWASIEGGEAKPGGTISEVRDFSLQEIVAMSEAEARAPIHDALNDLHKRQVFPLRSVQHVR